MQKVNSFRYPFFGGILLMLFALILSLFAPLNLDKIAAKASQKISEKLTICQKLLADLSAKDAFGDAENAAYTDAKIGLYVFRNDSLIQWNNSRFALLETPSDFSANEGFIKSRHGYFLYTKAPGPNNTVLLALCLVKPQYELQNNYLENNFSRWTGIPKAVELQIPNGAAEVKLLNVPIFSLNGNDEYYYITLIDDSAFVIFLIGFSLILVSLLFKFKQGISATEALAFAIGVILLRGLMLLFEWPSFFYRSLLFDVSIFGNAQSPFNAYLGDMLLNAAVVLFLGVATTFYFNNANSTIKIKRIEFTINALLFFILVNAFNHNIKSLVTNSTINFDFLNVLNFKTPAMVGLAIFCLYSIALFVVVKRLVSLLNGSFNRSIVTLLAINCAICLLQFFISEQLNFYIELLWPFIFSSCLFFLLRFGSGSFSLALGVQILLMALISSRFLNAYIEKNQKQELALLAFKLSEREDPILENEFAPLPEKIKADANLATLIRILPASADGIESLLRQRYFSGYFDRYTADLMLFDNDCRPLFVAKDGLLNNMGYFDDLITHQSDSTATPNLFFVREYHKNTKYISRIVLNTHTLYILLQAKQFEELGSFPDLLLDRSQQKHERLKAFSHAVYRQQQLSSHYGELNYPLFLQDSVTLAASHPGFVNHYYVPEENTVIVISEQAKRWTYFFTVNSYLLLFFSLFTYGFYLIYALSFTNYFKTPSLTRRIQTVIILLLLLAMSAIGYTSGSLVMNQFENDNRTLLEEKTQVIINELSSQYTHEQFFDESRKELINLKLKEYARLFNTPISLFNSAGRLSNTSESKLYDLGLSAGLVNPEAYYKLKNNLSSAVSVTEKAGKLNYLSFYTPIFSSKKELLGFVNLPYFAKQSALVNELSGIISALINVYVLLFVISILAGLILAGYITQPLRLIKQQIANISLGKQNEKITWQSNDEIGRLVSEYNQMLTKLEESANLLAQSERESAWREMAKQVAHEIKNPLTPMKLNLQYLQHVMKNEPADFKEKFEKSSLAIIEQIDALANIASEFSNFAKLPAASLMPINITDIISTSVLTFDSHKNIVILNDIGQKKWMIKGDSDQCLRVFNNILKNAVQAIEDVENPKIEISAQQKNKLLIVSIRDNGCGIADELKGRLFTPNFTTKSTGSGLGLAMVNNIMEGFGGKISFDSERGKGSIFYLQFVLSEFD